MIHVSTMFIPYLMLGLLTFGTFLIRSRKISAFLVALVLIAAFMYHIMDPLGLVCISVFWGMCTLHWRNPSSNKWVNTFRLCIIVATAIGFASHLVPGFHNWRVFSGMMLTPSSAPYTMYLNFDKTIAALIIGISSGLLLKQPGRFTKKNFSETLTIASLGVSLLAPMALLSKYVYFDVKFPEFSWLWAFNNLFLVCFAEEVIFRGIIQNYFMQFVSRGKASTIIPIFMGALLFALLLPGHFYGGPTFMAFATIAGLFYGYAYYRTNRLESAIIVHFIINLCHYLFLSYPMAASVVK